MAGMIETKPIVLSATTMIGNTVVDPEGEPLGKLEEIMIDVDYGCVAYGVLSFGGFMGLGGKLFAIPWKALRRSGGDHEFVLNADKELLKRTPGFDKDNWPDISDRAWGERLYGTFRVDPYW